VNVLFVEDYALGAALVRDTLRRRAPEIHLDIVSTVAQALARLAAFEAGTGGAPRYDVVLTDLNLPDGLGLEILSHVRGHNLMLAVVILTGSGDEDTVIGALHAGANDYVTKRDDYLDVLPRTLRSAVDRFRTDTARQTNPLTVLYADADAADFERVRVEINRRAPNIVLQAVHTADDMLQHLRSTSTPAPDVLLLSDRLPGLPTIELVKRVGAVEGLHLPVVLVTASGNEQLAQLAIRLGVADYLNKADGYLQRLPFALEGAHLKAVGVRERAALRKSESEYRALVDNLPDVVARFDRAGRHLFVSPAIEAASGRPPAFFIGKTHAEIGIPDALAQQFRSTLQQVFASGASVRIEFDSEMQSGLRSYESELTPELSADGKVETVLAIARDITERKQAGLRVAHYRDHLEEQVAARTAQLARANEALSAARDVADTANRAKSSFLANMSHEIRTPMSSIIGLARLLREETTEARPLDYLSKLQRAADHLLRIINDVLDLSKIEAHQLDLEEADFSLQAVLEAAVDMLQDRAADKGLRLELVLDEGLPRGLRGDALRLQQIVLNFVSNAIKFSAHGVVHIRARLAEATAQETLLRIEVQDHGIGVTPEQQARLFQSFSQADASIARQYGGTGLGLAIARRLAALMGGEVGVVSEATHGSTFWATVRLRNGSPQSPGEAQGAAAAVLHAAGLRILLAEDDPVNQLVTSRMLEQLGFEVDVVDNGAEAIEKVRAGRYALVLMDLHMPLMDGLTATRHIRQLHDSQALPIIAMTASAFEEDRRLCLAAGMDDHIGKPIRPEQLQAALLRRLTPGGIASAQPSA
jgi:PAS domain S-box-containing protein